MSTPDVRFNDVAESTLLSFPAEMLKPNTGKVSITVSPDFPGVVVVGPDSSPDSSPKKFPLESPSGRVRLVEMVCDEMERPKTGSWR